MRVASEAAKVVVACGEARRFAAGVANGSREDKRIMGLGSLKRGGCLCSRLNGFLELGVEGFVNVGMTVQRKAKRGVVYSFECYDGVQMTLWHCCALFILNFLGAG